MDWRKLLRDKRAWAVAGVGGVLGLYAATRARKGSSSAASGGVDPAAGPYVGMGGGTYDSSLQDIAEGFNQVAYDLQQQITEINDQLSGDTPPGPTTPPPGLEKWYSTKVRKKQTLFGFAQEHGGTLDEIIKHNPWLKGKRGSYVVKPGQIIKVRPLRKKAS